MNPTPPFAPPPGIPQLPRDHDQASMSEMVPFTSKKISLLRSPLTLFLALAAVLGPLLLVMRATLMESTTTSSAVKTFMYMAFSSVFFVIFSIGLLIYFYARPGRPLMPYVWGFVLIFLLMIPGVFGIPFILDLFITVFRALPGTDPFELTRASSVPEVFFAHFVGAGMMEEAFKAIPILIGFAIALRLSKQPGPPSPVASFFAIRGPLDGVLLGVFAGAAFILVETAGQYLPDQMIEGMERGRTLDAGVSEALLLYFPRVIGGAVGHVAYSGIFGYFIGLALLRRKHMVPLILGGYFIASWLHALWNASGAIDPNGYFYFFSAALKALCLVAVVLKARQLHVSRYGDADDTMGSLVIDRSGGGREAAPAVPGYGGMPPATVPYGGPPQPAFAGYAPNPAPYAAGAPVPAQAPQQQQQQPPFQGYASTAQPASAEQDHSMTPLVPLTLALAGRQVPLDAGALVDFAADPVLAVLGAGVRGDVVPHPSRPGVLGLRNSGAAAWVAYLRDGTSQQIDREQNIRLALGVRIDFGGGLIGDVVARG